MPGMLRFRSRVAVLLCAGCTALAGDPEGASSGGRRAPDAAADVRERLPIDVAVEVTVGADATPAAALSPEQADRVWLERSRSIFVELRKKRGPDYSYTSREGGPEAGTELQVRGDKVVQRRYQAGATDWTETGAEVGTHPDRHAAPALTIDQLHDACAAEVLAQSRASHLVRLTVGEDHLLTECSATPRDCADDCRAGYYISAVTWPR
jgi:hypothetical protein